MGKLYPFMKKSTICFVDDASTATSRISWYCGVAPNKIALMYRKPLRNLVVILLVLAAPGCDRSGPADDSHDQRSHSDRAVAAVENGLRRGNIEHPATLDPARAQSTHAFNVLVDLYEGLVVEGPQGKLLPGVAEKWDVSEDGLVYRFRLRSDARWSNGQRVVATDFVRALRRVMRPETNAPYAGLLSPIVGFGETATDAAPGVVANGDGDLEIRLSRPSPAFLRVLALPIAYPQAGLSDEAARFSDPARFVGNGAYTLVHYQVGQPVQLQKNPHYWAADSVALDTVEYVAVVDEMTELRMYQTGALDITASIPALQLNRLRTSLPGEVHVSPTLALYYLALDLTEPPLDDVALRRALSLAIDRKALVDVIGRGEQPAYGVVPPGIDGYRNAVYEWRDEDSASRISLAKATYAAAGYDSDRPLQLTLLYDAGGIHERIAVAVSEMWRDILGVEVALDKREWQYFLETRKDRGQWQVMRFAWFGDYIDPTTFLDLFRSQGVQNLTGYANVEYDELLARAELERNAPQRYDMLQKAETMMLTEYPVIPLYFFVSKHLVKPDIEGFQSHPLDRLPSKYLSRKR